MLLHIFSPPHLLFQNLHHRAAAAAGEENVGVAEESWRPRLPVFCFPSQKPPSQAHRFQIQVRGSLWGPLHLKVGPTPRPSWCLLLSCLPLCLLTFPTSALGLPLASALGIWVTPIPLDVYTSFSFSCPLWPCPSHSDFGHSQRGSETWEGGEWRVSHAFQGKLTRLLGLSWAGGQSQGGGHTLVLSPGEPAIQ